jgi:hypothetical protein
MLTRLTHTRHRHAAPKTLTLTLSTIRFQPWVLTMVWAQPLGRVGVWVHRYVRM